MEVKSENGIQVLSLKGGIHNQESELLEQTLQQVYDRGNIKFIIDLSRVSHICSSALGVLVTYKREVSAAGGDLRLILSNDYMNQLFEITMLDKVFEIYSNIDNAMSSF